MKYIKSTDSIYEHVWLFIYAVGFGIAAALTKALFLPALKRDVIEGIHVPILTFSNLVIFILGVAVSYIGILTIRNKLRNLKVTKEAKNDARNGNRIFLFSFSLNILSWVVWFMVYYPGAGMNDTINCIRSSNDILQPLVYQLLINNGIKVFSGLTNSVTNAYAILVIIQMIFMSLSIAWVAKWLSKKNIKQPYIIVFILYYAFMPVICDYSITLIKDTLFAVSTMLLIPLLYDFIKDESVKKTKKFWVAFVGILIGIDVLRPNGKIIIIIVLGVLILQRKMKMKYFISILILVSIINSVIGNIESKRFAEDVKFRESVSVPLVQIGAVLKADGYISNHDQTILSDIMPLEEWGNKYAFSLTDPIKFSGDFNNNNLNENKAAFLRTWYSIMTDNFTVYVKSYLCHSYGFWNISPFNAANTDYSQSFFTQVNNNTDIDSYWGTYIESIGLRNKEIYPNTFRAVLDTFFKGTFFINLILGTGLMIWLVMGGAAILMSIKKYQICTTFLPVIITWLTMLIASPSSLIYRYSFYLVLSIPILILILLLEINN